MFLGVLILLLGVLLLLQKLDIISGGVWEFFWPAAVIAIGISMIVKNRHPKK